ncbi:hypothetical protein SS50377_22610 [Spironucleus salmonicida]|uniref:Uncharacterized protein n=1 Tax=Spironucleus salmonicida TaxID=348837 RepID=V6LBP5_9EUKA|nr:hypothetical protein SS50377_22610 [Spironucleus salmonicida]|eukprot:EST41900.1 Hypothetical protein SS50377_18203 [Spironucleus salmonicida]
MSQCSCCLRPYPQECYVKVIAPQLEQYGKVQQQALQEHSSSVVHQQMQSSELMQRCDQVDISVRELCQLVESCQVKQAKQGNKLKSVENAVKSQADDLCQQNQQIYIKLDESSSNLLNLSSGVKDIYHKVASLEHKQQNISSSVESLVARQIIFDKNVTEIQLKHQQLEKYVYDQQSQQQQFTQQIIEQQTSQVNMVLQQFSQQFQLLGQQQEQNQRIIENLVNLKSNNNEKNNQEMQTSIINYPQQIADFPIPQQIRESQDANSQQLSNIDSLVNCLSVQNSSQKSSKNSTHDVVLQQTQQMNQSQSTQQTQVLNTSFQQQIQPETRSISTSPYITNNQEFLQNQGNQSHQYSSSGPFDQTVSSQTIIYSPQPIKQRNQIESVQNNVQNSIYNQTSQSDNNFKQDNYSQKPDQTITSPTQQILILDQNAYNSYLNSIQKPPQYHSTSLQTSQIPQLTAYPLTATDEAFNRLNDELEQKFKAVELSDFSQVKHSIQLKSKINDSLVSSIQHPMSQNERQSSQSQNSTEFYKKSSSSGGSNKSQNQIQICDLTSKKSQISLANTTPMEGILQSSQSAQQVQRYKQIVEQRGQFGTPDGVVSEVFTSEVGNQQRENQAQQQNDRVYSGGHAANYFLPKEQSVISMIQNQNPQSVSLNTSQQQYQVSAPHNNSMLPSAVSPANDYVISSQHEVEIPTKPMQNVQHIPPNVNLEALFENVLQNNRESISSQMEEINSLTTQALAVSAGSVQTEKRSAQQIMPLKEKLLDKVDSALDYVKQLRSEGNSLNFSGME